MWHFRWILENRMPMWNVGVIKYRMKRGLWRPWFECDKQDVETSHVCLSPSSLYQHVRYIMQEFVWQTKKQLSMKLKAHEDKGVVVTPGNWCVKAFDIHAFPSHNPLLPSSFYINEFTKGSWAMNEHKSYDNDNNSRVHHFTCPCHLQYYIPTYPFKLLLLLFIIKGHFWKLKS